MQLPRALGPLAGIFNVLAIASACAVTAPPTSSVPLGPAREAETSTEPSATSAPAAGTPDPRPEHALAKVPVSTADPQWGSVDAPVTIVEFSDFECPFCSRVGPTLAQLKQKYGPGQLRIVWKNNPLPFHKAARPTADTSAAVFMLAGPKAFWRFHDQAFANQQDLTPQNLEAWANEAGVTSQALFSWIEAGKPAAKVQEDMELAKAVGATGTPAFRINGVTVSGAQPLEKFVEVVDEQLAAAKQLTQSGLPPRLVYNVLTDKNLQAQPTAPSTVVKNDEDDLKIWNVPVAADDPVRGPRDALVTIVHFSEFQCPFCKRVEATLDELIARIKQVAG